MPLLCQCIASGSRLYIYRTSSSLPITTPHTAYEACFLGKSEWQICKGPVCLENRRLFRSVSRLNSHYPIKQTLFPAHRTASLNVIPLRRPHHPPDLLAPPSSFSDKIQPFPTSRNLVCGCVLGTKRDPCGSRHVQNDRLRAGLLTNQRCCQIVHLNLYP